MLKKTYAQCAKCTLQHPKKNSFAPHGKGAVFYPTLEHTNMAQKILGTIEAFYAADTEELHLYYAAIQGGFVSYPHTDANGDAA